MKSSIMSRKQWLGRIGGEQAVKRFPKIYANIDAAFKIFEAHSSRPFALSGLYEALRQFNNDRPVAVRSFWDPTVELFEQVQSQISPTPTLPPLMMSRKQWLARIGGAQAVNRFPHLYAKIDATFQDFEAHPLNYATLNALYKELEAFDKQKKVFKEKSAVVTLCGDPTAELFEQVQSRIKTRPALQREQKALDDIVSETRRGILWLFAHTEVEMGLRTLVSKMIIQSVKIAMNRAGFDKVATEFMGERAAFTEHFTVELRDQGYELAEKVMNASGKVVGEKVSGRSAQPVAVKIRPDEKESFYKSLARGIEAVWDAVCDLVIGVGAVGAEVIADYKKEFFSDRKKLPLLIVELFMAQVLPTVAPFWSSVKQSLNALPDIYKNVINTIMQEFKNKASFRSGFSRDMASGTRMGVALMGLEASANFGMGVARLGMTFAEAAVKPFVIVLYELLKAVAKLVLRLIERFRLHRFCTSAQKKYKEAGFKLNGKFNPADESLAAITRNSKEFDRWFGSAARWCPMIPMTLIASHIAGNAYSYLNMFDTDGNVIDSKTFLSGVGYQNWQKDRARAYLNWSGIEMRLPKQVNLKPFLENSVGILRAM